MSFGYEKGSDEARAVSDEVWEKLKDGLLCSEERRGITADNRLFVDAVLYVGKPGIRWRYLAARCGKWNPVYVRFSTVEARPGCGRRYS